MVSARKAGDLGMSGASAALLAGVFDKTIVIVFLSTTAFALFSDDEFRIMRSLCRFFNIGFLVFIEDNFTSPEGLDAVKRSSEVNIASTAVTSGRLMDILSSDGNFFKQRTMLATKKRIHLGPLLKLVQSPKLVLWILFVEPSDSDFVGRDLPYYGRVLRIKREEDHLVAYELLHTNESGAIVQRKFAYVSISSAAEYFPREWQYYSQTMNMSNFVVKVGISSEICRSRKDGLFLEVIFCSHTQILELMAEKLNIRIEYVRHPETQYSFVFPNGSYSGYFKMVLDKEVNMSVAGFVVTAKRLADFDFIWPTFALDTTMYLKKADLLKASLSNSPFSSAVWIVISTWIIVTGSFLCISGYCNKEWGTLSRKVSQAATTSILKIFQLLCNQGSSDDPSSFSGRILHITSLFGGMLLYYHYSAVVLSYLTVESVDLPFTDLEGFIENKKYKIVAPAGGFVSYFMEFELTQFRHRVGKYMVPSDRLPLSIDDCVRAVCDKKSLVLLELEGLLLNMQGTKCELAKIPTPVFTQFFGFALMKGFPFTEYFEMVLWRLREIGFMERMHRNLSNFNGLQTLYEDSQDKAVALEQIMNVLVILSLGLLLSFSILILEFLYYRVLSERRLKREACNTRLGGRGSAVKGVYFLEAKSRR